VSLPIRGEHEGRHDVQGGPPYGGWAAFATVYPIYRSYIVTGHAVPRSGATPDTVQRTTRTAAVRGGLRHGLTTVTWSNVVTCNKNEEA
jgi:hypothetical protein